MSRLLATLTLALVILSGLLKGSGPAPPRPLPALPILLYHRVSDHLRAGDGGRVMPIDELDSHLAYLEAAGFTTLHFADVAAIQDGRRPCPERPVVLTFDDGYDDNFANAYALLYRHHQKAVFLPIVGSIGRAGHITWKKWGLIDHAVLEVGSHSMTHRPMAGMSPEGLTRELVLSKRTLEQVLGFPVLSFAFPSGSHDDAAVAAAVDAGYRFVLTTRMGRNPLGGDTTRMRRFTVYRGLPLATLARWVGGPPPDRLPGRSQAAALRFSTSSQTATTASTIHSE